MMSIFKLDVYGKKMIARYSDRRWHLSIAGPEGKSRPVRNMIVPSDIKTAEEYERASIAVWEDLKSGK